MPKKIATADCETDPFKLGRIPQPFIWGFYSPDHGQLYFTDTNEFIKFLALEIGENYRVYMHNGGKFDFHYLLHAVENWQKINMINGRIAKMHIGACELVDSYCILPVGLSAYQKTEIDYNKFEKENREKHWQEICDYLADDCKFLFELVEGFINENGYSLTIASAAIKKLQKIEKIKIEDSGRNYYENMLPYYYGGRVECFNKGIISGDITYLDINSAYPFAMRHNHPWGNYIKSHQSNPILSGHNFYSFRARSLGAFPWRDENNALQFPNDGEIRKFHVTGWEIIAAHELGLLKDCEHLEQRIFFETKNYQNYVDYYYTIKSTSKKGSPENIYSKLFLNSAYGKFAANPAKYTDTFLCKHDDIGKALAEGFSIHGEIHDRLIISKPNDPTEWRHYNIAVGASITGFVRAYLFDAICSVENPLYCDTDSIIFTGNHSLPLNENDLGAWSIEGVFNKGGIGGKKIYAFENTETGKKKHACKGLRLNFDEVMQVCQGAEIKRTPENPIYSLKRGIYFQEKTIKIT